MSLFQKAKEILGAVGIVYAFGFLAFRSHLNSLGVWSGPPVMSETYLEVGAKFLIVSLGSLLRPVGTVAVLLILIGYGLRSLICRIGEASGSRFLRGAHGYLGIAGESLKATRQLTFPLFIVCALSALLLEFFIEACVSDYILPRAPVGMLLSNASSYVGYIIATTNAFSVLFDGVLLYFILLLIWLMRELKNKDSRYRMFRILIVAILTVSTAVWLPIWYGVFLHSKEVPIATISVNAHENTSSDAGTEIALLFSEGSTLTTFSKKSNVIAVLTLDESRVLKIHRYRNIFTWIFDPSDG